MEAADVTPLQQADATYCGALRDGGRSRSRIDHVVVSVGGKEWWAPGSSSMLRGRECGHRVVTHRSHGDRLGTFLRMGDWGRRWRKASARARAQREAERRALPSGLAAHEVEAFRAQWEKGALGPAEHVLEELRQ